MLYPFISYIKHYATATNTGGHGVHSPYLFGFIKTVVEGKHPYYCYSTIEQERRGITSKLGQASLKPHLAQLLHRTVLYSRAKHIVQLGVSQGVAACYLATASPQGICTIFEESEAMCSQAEGLFAKCKVANINVVQGNIYNNYTLYVKNSNKIDLLFINNCHACDSIEGFLEVALPKLHKESVVIFRDIYSSKEKAKAWKKMIEIENVTSSFDLYHLGFLFFNTDFQQKKYKISV